MHTPETGMADLERLREAIVNGNHKAAKEVTQAALAEGVDPQLLVNDIMIPAMNEVGKLYEAGDYFVPELLIAARAMKASLELIRPLLIEKGAEPVGRVVIGTVKGDLHDIGKNLVSAMLEGAGFVVTDLGVDVAPEKFVSAARENNASLVALSALLTTTMGGMKAVVEALDAAGLHGKVKVMIGGAPTTQKYARDIGADGYGSNANSAVALAHQLLRG
jgi:corrinoid protein of di/trimethylamine methyltransferase